MRPTEISQLLPRDTSQVGRSMMEDYNTDAFVLEEGRWVL